AGEQPQPQLHARAVAQRAVMLLTDGEDLGHSSGTASPLRSERINSMTRAAISAGWIRRPQGLKLPIDALTCSLLIPVICAVLAALSSISSVSVKPGQTALAVRLLP